MREYTKTVFPKVIAFVLGLVPGGKKKIEGNNSKTPVRIFMKLDSFIIVGVF